MNAVLRLDLEITSLSSSGDGVARGPDGRVVFVPLTAPGDRVRVRLVRTRKRHAHGRVEEVLEASDRRTAPACSHYGQCGGCSWQHLQYPSQLMAKQEILKDALQRIGGFTVPGPIPIHSSPEYGYRSRARLAVRNHQIGYRRRSSHDLLTPAACPVLMPELEKALLELAARPELEDGEWELALATDGRVRTVRLSSSSQRIDKLELSVLGERVRISPGVFSQGNSPLLGVLAERVHEASGEGARVLELHAGAGTFSLGLARRHSALLAVERDRRAWEDLEANLEDAGVPGTRTLMASDADALRSNVVRSFAPETVVLDPPRAGLGRTEARALAALPARRVVYLSCDPATLARDLAELRGRGFRLLQVEAFDLFPQTPHVEALAVLVREPQ